MITLFTLESNAAENILVDPVLKTTSDPKDIDVPLTVPTTAVPL